MNTAAGGGYEPLPSPTSPTRRYVSPSHSHHSSQSTSSESSLRALELSDGPSYLDRPTRNRANSVGSVAFLYQPDILPLSLSEAEQVGEPTTEKTVGLTTGIALVVGLQIGSGIFSSPGVVLANTKSVGAALVVWVIGGLLAWTGASSFAELGSMIPLNGGAQAYLAYAYGPLTSFLFAWTTISVVKPGGNAIIALIFGEYVNRLLYHASGVDAAPDAIPGWAIKLTAVIAVLVISLLCIASPKSATRAAVVFTVVKIAALVAITVLGLIQLARGRASTSLTEPLFSGTSSNPSSFALALYSGLWAYDGWDQSNYVAGEIKNVEKNLPKMIHISMAIVLTLFLAANISYFVLLDKSTVMLSNTVALDFGRALFGPIGAIVFSAMVAFSCFGALNGSFFTSARLISVAGREGFLPAFFGRLHSTRKTPINAMGLQAFMTVLFIVFGGGFRSLVNFYSVAQWGFYFLTVLGLVVLRVKEPQLERPYRAYIITPLTFSAVALFLLCMPVFAAPMEALAAVGFISVGVPVYYISQRRRTSGLSSSNRKTTVDSDSGPLSRFSVFFSRLTSGMRGKGYQAAGGVHQDVEEERVEMLEARD